MRRSESTYLIGVGVLIACVSLCPLDGAVRVENLMVSQRDDGSRKVDIAYDLVAASEHVPSSVRVDIVLSNDGGRSWGVVPPASALTGDYGPSVTVGNGKRVIYDVLEDQPGLAWSGVAARLQVTTGQEGESVTLELPGGVPIEFVRIPAGAFDMGSPENERGRSGDEGPLHRVTIADPFYMSRYQITQSQWAAVMGSHPARRYGIGDDFPVFYVSWDAAHDFVNRVDRVGLGHFRMPSEAEWEYACRGGTQTRYFFGDSLDCDDVCGDCEAGVDSGKRSDYMWYCANHGPPGEPDYAAKPVGRRRPNPFGLYDMSGNLWEWCRDAYAPDYQGAPTDGSARQGPPGSSRVLRGGAWDYHSKHCRSASRAGYVPWRSYTFHGVRLVWSPFAKESDSWFATWEARAVADNMISYQTVYDGWPKNLNMFEQGFQGEKFTKNWGTTLDNGATVRQLRFLGRVCYATQLERAVDSFVRGLDFLLNLQYPNGGFPQRYPEGHDYGDFITFNDDVMARALRLLRNISDKPEFAWVDVERRTRARAAYEKGLRCTLDCQIVVGGRRTIWGGQHDPVTLEPRPARSFEPNGLCSRESAAVAVFLMSLKNPSADVVEAVEAAVTWFREARITGTRLAREDGDLVLVEDANAPPLWARFYDLEGGRPMFAGMDGVVKYAINEIDRERRNGYGWYNQAGEVVFQAYAEWKKRVQ